MWYYKRLAVWRMADAFVRALYPVLDRLPPRDGFAIRDQLWRAAISVPCNIVEGSARNSDGSMRYHLEVAAGSLSEAQYLLELAADIGALPREQAAPLIELAGNLRPRLGAFAAALTQARRTPK